jgi:hypothetical protein
LVKAKFYAEMAKAKNALALGVRVNAIVERFVHTDRHCKPKYFLMCFAKMLSISVCRGTGCFCPVCGFT